MVVFVFFLSVSSSPLTNSSSDSYISVPRSIYLPHDPIIITNNSDLAAVATSGTGAVNDPYFITGWKISGSPSHGIFVTETTQHFRIENCLVYNCERGIGVERVTYGTVTITNNTCTNNDGTGIQLWDSGASTITNNTCTNNDGAGIQLWRSDSSTITNNTCTNNGGIGIYLEDSDTSTVANNTCINNDGAGIRLGDSVFSTVAHNTLFDDGLVLEASSKEKFISYTVENNMVNDLPLGYFENLIDSTITKAYGQLILINCTNSIVKNQNCSNASIGIALHYCHENQLVNNTCNNNDEIGISLGDSGSSTLVNNTCNNNLWTGILLSYSNSSILINNTCTNNGGTGIDIRESGASIYVALFKMDGQSNREAFHTSTSRSS